jgi:hypothetical protein
MDKVREYGEGRRIFPNIVLLRCLYTQVFETRLTYDSTISAGKYRPTRRNSWLTGRLALTTARLTVYRACTATANVSTEFPTSGAMLIRPSSQAPETFTNSACSNTPSTPPSSHQHHPKTNRTSQPPFHPTGPSPSLRTLSIRPVPAISTTRCKMPKPSASIGKRVAFRNAWVERERTSP